MKKICIICTYEYPIPAVKGGAIEQIVENICNVNEIKQKLDITVLTTYDKAAEAKYSDYKYSKFVPFNKYYIDKLIFFAFRVIKKVFHRYIPTSIRMVKVKKWIEDHNSEVDYFVYEDGLTYMLPFLFKNINRNKVISHLHWVGDPIPSSNRYFSHLLCVSDYVGKVWLATSNTPKVSVTTIKNGISLNKFEKKISAEEEIQIREKYQLREDDFIVLYVGRIVPEKGVLELISAIDLIDDNNVVLMLIGAANFGLKTKTTYEKKVASATEKSKHRIIMTGFIRNEELYKYQNIADVAVIPTLIEEAAPLACVENMAAGLPLIITNSGGMPEYASKDSTFVVNKKEDVANQIAEKILLIERNADLKKKMGKYASIAAGKFSIEATYDKFVNFFNSLS